MRIEAAQMRTGFHDSYSIILIFMMGFALRFLQHSFINNYSIFLSFQFVSEQMDACQCHQIGNFTIRT